MSNNKFNARHGLSVGSTPVDIIDDTGAILVNSASATKLATARTISVSGDAAGSVLFDGSSNADIALTIQPNSVALGTDTTGNYMLDVSPGTGVSISHTQGEGSTATVSIGQAVGTTDNVTFNNVTVNGTLNSDDITSTNISVAGNATITGNLTVSGTTTTINSTTIALADLALELARNATSAAQANGAGITVTGPATPANLTYTSIDDRWNFNKNLNVATVYGALSGNASTASAWQTGRSISITGDATWTTTIDGSANVTGALTLANSGVTAGTYGSSTSVPVVTVDAKGRVTGVTTSSISGSLTFTGDVTGTGSTGASTALTLAASGVTAGSYTYSSITVDAKGRVTAASSGAAPVTTSITATSPIVASAATGAVTLSHANSGVTAGTYNNVTVNALGHVTGGSNTSYLTSYTESDTLATVTGRGNTTTANINTSSTSVINLATAGNLGVWLGGIQDSTTGWSLSGASIGLKADNTTYAAIGIGTTNGLLYFARTNSSGTGTMSSWLEVNSAGVANFKLARPQYNGNTILDASNYTSYSPSVTYSRFTGDANTLGLSQATSGIYTMGVASNTPSTYGTLTSFWNVDISTQFLLTYNGDAYWRKTATSTTWAAWRTFLDSSNYTSYSPTLSGNYKNLSVGGIYSRYSYSEGTYISDTTTAYTLSPDYGQTTVAMHNTHGLFGSWATTLTMSGYERYGAYQISGDYNASTPRLAIRNYNQGTANWTSWTLLLSSANYNSYAPTLTGGGASGTWSINVTGSAGSTSAVGIHAGNEVNVGGGYAGGGTLYFNYNDGGSYSNLSIYNGGTGLATITASNITAAGNVTGSSTSCTGNAASATNVSGGNVQGSYFGVQQTGGSGAGISLYNGSTSGQPQYGIMFATTANFSTHGSVTADWATYFTMDSTANRGWVFRNTVAGNVASVNNSGTAVFNGNVTAYSDERLKKDWEALPGNFVAQLAEVKNGTYTRIDSNERQIGVGAQSLQSLMPEAVLDGEYLSVAYGNAALASAVELAKEVVDLRARVAQLENLISKFIKE